MDITPQLFDSVAHPATTPNKQRNVFATAGVALLMGAFLFSLAS